MRRIKHSQTDHLLMTLITSTLCFRLAITIDIHSHWKGTAVAVLLYLVYLIVRNTMRIPNNAMLSAASMVGIIAAMFLNVAFCSITYVNDNTQWILVPYCVVTTCISIDLFRKAMKT